MQTITTTKTSFIAVKVPETSTGFQIFNYPDKSYLWYCIKNILETDEIELPLGDYKIIGILSSITEEMAKELVEAVMFGKWKNYNIRTQHEEYLLNTATESLHTLLTSNGYNIKDNLLIIKKLS